MDTLGNKALRPKLKKFGRLLLKTSLILTLIIGVLLGILGGLVYYFQDDIKKYAIETLNENLQTKLDVESIDITVLKQFPYASLEFKNVVCAEAYERSNSQALFSAGRIYLQFNLWNVIDQNYTVKKITVEDAAVNLYRDKNGKDNWHFWKISDDTSSSKKSFSFKLSAVQLKNVDINYIDEYAQVEIETHFDYFNMAGRFSDKQFALNANTEFVAKRVMVQGVTYSDNYKLKLHAKFWADTEKQLYKIKSCDLQIEDLPLKASGEFGKDETAWYIDVDLQGKNLNISRILSMLPESIREIKENYKSSGKIEIKAKVKGHFIKGSFPSIHADYSVSKATFKYVPSSVEMENVTGNGSLYIAKRSESFFKIDYVEAFQKNSSLKGSFEWKDFDNPLVVSSAELNADLAEFLPFFPIDTIEQVNGRANLKLDLVLKASGKNFTKEDFRNAKMDGNMELQNVVLRLKNSPLQFNDITGIFMFDNNNVWLRKASGIFNENRIELDGKALNLLSYILTEDEPLYLSVNLKSEEVNIDKWLTQNTTAQNTSKDTSKSVFALPKRLSIDFDAEVKKITFTKFEATNVRGSVSIKNRVFAAKSLTMTTMDGEAIVSGIADNSNGNWNVTANGRFTNINASKLFYTFDNFQQNQLTHENISGSVDAVFDFKAKFDPYLSVDLKSVYSLINLTISKGELKNFTPLEKLAGWVKLEELQHVKFSTLKNEILIKDEKVMMPEMSIVNNAMNLNLGGEHGFNNVVDYRINMDLGTLLANKFKLKRSAKQEEFGEIIEEPTGRMRIYVHMYGHMDDLKFGLDGRGMRQKMADDIKKEKLNVRDLLQQEFGKVKNDSILKSDPWLRERQEKRDSIRKVSRGTESTEFEFE